MREINLGLVHSIQLMLERENIHKDVCTERMKTVHVFLTILLSQNQENVLEADSPLSYPCVCLGRRV